MVPCEHSITAQDCARPRLLSLSLTRLSSILGREREGEIADAVLPVQAPLKQVRTLLTSPYVGPGDGERKRARPGADPS